MFTVKVYRVPENGDCPTKKDITEKEMEAWVHQYVLVRKFEQFSELKTYVKKDIFKDLFIGKTLPKMIEIYHGDYSLVSHGVFENRESATFICWRRASQFDPRYEVDNEYIDKELIKIKNEEKKERSRQNYGYALDLYFERTDWRNRHYTDKDPGKELHRYASALANSEMGEYLKKWKLDKLIKKLVEETVCMDEVTVEINCMSKAYYEIKRRLAGGYQEGFSDGYLNCYGELRAEEGIELYGFEEMGKPLTSESEEDEEE